MEVPMDTPNKLEKYKSTHNSAIFWEKYEIWKVWSFHFEHGQNYPHLWELH